MHSIFTASGLEDGDIPLDLSLKNNKPLNFTKLALSPNEPDCYTCNAVQQTSVDVPEDQITPVFPASERPFKALAKRARTASESFGDMTSLLLNSSATEDEDLKKLLEDFEERRAQYKEKMAAHLTSNSTGCNQNMRRTQNNKDKISDPEYLEKRKKNNESAKRSRDARRHKQDELAITAGFLELECVKLKCQIQAVCDELAHLG